MTVPPKLVSEALQLYCPWAPLAQSSSLAPGFADAKLSCPSALTAKAVREYFWPGVLSGCWYSLLEILPAGSATTVTIRPPLFLPSGAICTEIGRAHV